MHHPIREYQQAAVDDLRRALAAGNKRVLLQLATGSGKTRIAAEIIRLASDKGKTVLFLAPRRELIYQAAEAFKRQDIHPGIIMAGEMPHKADVQIASFDTLHARAIRSNRILLPDANLVIVDEAHLSIAQSRKDIIERYPEAALIGLTATPARGDGRGLGEIYEALVFGPSISELVEMGHLVPMRYFAPTAPDLSMLKLNKDGDYIEEALGSKMDQPQLIGDIVDNWRRIAGDRHTVVFCVNCAHSRHVRDAFLDAGITAEHVDGETPAPERASIFARVKSGETQVLTNVFVASYGLDIPRLDCAVLARPTKNIALYLQTIGRVMRPFDGKTDALVIDHSGAVKENGFADDYVPWSLDAKERVKDRKEAADIEKAKPKQIECAVCKTLFAGRRNCPSCGHEMIPGTSDIPVFQADLLEIQRNAKKDNKQATWAQKIEFIGGLKSYARQHGYQEGWVAHKYAAKFSVWPNDPRVKNAPMAACTEEVRKWIVSQNIRHAKSASR